MALIITVLVATGLLVLLFRKVSRDYDNHMDSLLASCLTDGGDGTILRTKAKESEYSILYREADGSIVRQVISATNKHEAIFDFVKEYEISAFKIEEVKKL